MKRDRFFYVAAGAIFLVLTVIGFQAVHLSRQAL